MNEAKHTPGLYRPSHLADAYADLLRECDAHKHDAAVLRGADRKLRNSRDNAIRLCGRWMFIAFAEALAIIGLLAWLVLR